MALPIWALYMKDVYENQNLGISKDDFEVPEIVKRYQYIAKNLIQISTN